MAEQAAYNQHVALAAEIRYLCNLGHHLIDELHNKRCVLRGSYYRFEPQYRYLDPLYKKILYMGRRRKTSFDPFPSSFQCYLDDAFAIAAPALFNAGVYYGNHDPVYVWPDEWTLDPHDATNDSNIIRHYRDLLIDFMQRAINIVENSPVSRIGLSKMTRELSRFAN